MYKLGLKATDAAGAEQVVNVSLKPTEAKDYTGTVTVESDAANAAKGDTGATEGKNTISVFRKRQSLPTFSKSFPRRRKSLVVRV